MIAAVRAAILWAVLASVAAATQAAEAPPPERAIELRTSELRLLDDAVRLRLNTGWLAARAVRGDAHPDQRQLAGTFDLRRRRGRLSLGGGDERRLRLHMQWDIQVEQDTARIRARIEMAALGLALTLTPPDVRVRPRFDGGEPGVDVSVPILEGHF